MSHRHAPLPPVCSAWNRQPLSSELAVLLSRWLQPRRHGHSADRYAAHSAVALSLCADCHLQTLHYLLGPSPRSLEATVEPPKLKAIQTCSPEGPWAHFTGWSSICVYTAILHCLTCGLHSPFVLFALPPTSYICFRPEPIFELTLPSEFFPGTFLPAPALRGMWQLPAAAHLLAMFADSFANANLVKPSSEYPGYPLARSAYDVPSVDADQLEDALVYADPSDEAAVHPLLLQSLTALLMALSPNITLRSVDGFASTSQRRRTNTDKRR